MKGSAINTANYVVAAIALLALLKNWLQYWQAKATLANPLIPESLRDFHYKPALLFTGIYAVVIVMQLLGVYWGRHQRLLAILGAIVLIAGSLSYTVVTNELLNHH